MIVPIRLQFSNAYLIPGQRPILVDCGNPNDLNGLRRALARHNVQVQDLALLLFTHAHYDHCGTAAALKQAYPCLPLAVGAGDAGWLRQGQSGPLHPINLEGRLFGALIPGTAFPACAPDQVIDGEFSLAPYGVNGRVLLTPGHTAGSLSVVLDDGEAITGDLLRGGYLGGAIRPTRPMQHYFADDLAQMQASLAMLAALPLTRLYPGHGGPLDAAEAWRRLLA